VLESSQVRDNAQTRTTASGRSSCACVSFWWPQVCCCARSRCCLSAWDKKSALALQPFHPVSLCGRVDHLSPLPLVSMSRSVHACLSLLVLSVLLVASTLADVNYAGSYECVSNSCGRCTPEPLEVTYISPSTYQLYRLSNTLIVTLEGGRFTYNGVTTGTYAIPYTMTGTLGARSVVVICTLFDLTPARDVHTRPPTSRPIRPERFFIAHHQARPGRFATVLQHISEQAASWYSPTNYQRSLANSHPVSSASQQR